MLALVLVVGAAVGGCGNGLDGGALADAEQRWTDAGITDYTYTLTSECGERQLIGTFSLTVTDGAVSAAEGVGDAASWVPDTALAVFPSIDDLFGVLHGAHEVSAAYDDELGYPTNITIDWHREAIDDEECYVVSDLAAR